MVMCKKTTNDGPRDAFDIDMYVCLERVVEKIVQILSYTINDEKSLLPILSLALLNPFPPLPRRFRHRLFVGRYLLHPMWRRHVPPLLHRWPLKHLLLPIGQVRELTDFYPRIPRRCHPAPVRNIGDGALVTDEIARGRFGKVGIQHAIQAARFVHVPIHAVFDFLGGVVGEVVGLSLHGTYARVEEEEPIVDFVGLA